MESLRNGLSSQLREEKQRRKLIVQISGSYEIRMRSIAGEKIPFELRSALTGLRNLSHPQARIIRW